jgi:hypothetical protein
MRWLAVLAVIAGLASHASSDAERMLAMAGFLAAATVWLGLIDRHAAVEQSTMVDDWRARIAQLDWIDAAILPLLFVAEGGEIAARSAYVAYAVAAVLFIAFAWRRAANSLRDAAAAGAIASAVFAIAEYAPERPLLFVSLLTAVAIGSLAANVQRKSASWIVGCIAVLLLGGTMTLDALATRPIYQFTPFATEASLAALIVTLGFAALGRFAYPLAPWIWGFVWGLFELAMAFSPSTSTLLLVVYFAATGVVCVAAGRARQSARLRQTGLALALIAAGTAFYGASTYFDSGVRIVAYLVTSAFLLGIAYWYRRPGSAESPAATA